MPLVNVRKSKMSENEIVVVFTDESISRIREKGGTSAWRLKPSHARRCSFVLCTRNQNGDGVNLAEEHHTGFLLGKVEEVVPVPGPDHKKRYLIRFSEYAEVNIPDAWEEGLRNPVGYSTLEGKGIDPTKLEWTPMPAQKTTGAPERTPHIAAISLTMQQAKDGLALTFGVAPEAIEITIRG
jgi:hypothetical protein